MSSLSRLLLLHGLKGPLLVSLCLTLLRSVAKPQAGVQKEEQSSSSTGVAVSSNPCWLHGDNGVIV